MSGGFERPSCTARVLDPETRTDWRLTRQTEITRPAAIPWSADVLSSPSDPIREVVAGLGTAKGASPASYVAPNISKAPSACVIGGLPKVRF
jgi:hypothetical protein